MCCCLDDFFLPFLFSFQLNQFGPFKRISGTSYGQPLKKEARVRTGGRQNKHCRDEKSYLIYIFSSSWLQLLIHKLIEIQIRALFQWLNAPPSFQTFNAPISSAPFPSFSLHWLKFCHYHPSWTRPHGSTRFAASRNVLICIGIMLGRVRCMHAFVSVPGAKQQEQLKKVAWRVSL